MPVPIGHDFMTWAFLFPSLCSPLEVISEVPWIISSFYYPLTLHKLLPLTRKRLVKSSEKPPSLPSLFTFPATHSSESSAIIQFSSLTHSFPTLWDPMDCSTPGFPVHLQFLKLAQIHVHWVSDAIQPSHLLSFPSPDFSLSQNQGLF